MDTLRFLDLVLADEGYRCIATLSPVDGGRMRQHFLQTNAEAAALALRVDRDPLQVFHACANFLTPTSRKAVNVVAVRSWWADLDVGPGKPYATAQEAARALTAFEVAVGLPLSLLVKSGTGLHAYWPASRDLSPTEWLTGALLLKAAADKFGLLVDPSRAKDIASVLRPPGTTHRKGDPKPVRVLRWSEQHDPAQITQALADYTGMAVEADTLGPRPAHITGTFNNDLKAGMDHPPAYADRVADNCAVVDRVRNPTGKVDQGTWYHVLQVLQRCEDGAEKAHDWSKLDPRYTPHETAVNLARLEGLGPTLCSKLGDFNAAICAACPHAGKIKSPITLGTAPVVDTEIMIQTPAAPGTAFGTAVEEKPLEMPYSYAWRRAVANSPINQLCREVTVEGEDPTWRPISNTLFYPVNRLAGSNGAAMEIEMHVRGDERRRFTVETATITKGGDGLSAILGRHEITAMPGQKPVLENYLTAWIDKMKSEVEAITSASHFGWHGRNFVIGNQLLRGGGPVPAVLEGFAREIDGFDTQGTLQGWVDVVDTAYNAPDQEAFQFLVLCSFAAPLFALFKDYGGVTVFAHSQGTGVGKTTAQRAGLAAWGNWSDLQQSDEKTTDAFLWGFLGACHNLPVMYDELTNATNAKASNIVFSVSSGRAKQRMQGGGMPQANNSNWSTILMASGNTLLSDKIGQHRGDASAELARLFEFSVDKNSHLTPNQAAQLFPKLLDNYGHAGREFMQYVVDHIDEVIDLQSRLQISLNDEMNVGQEERYWSALFASVLTSLVIARGLGLVGFALRPLKAWMLDQLGRNRVSREENVLDQVALFMQMLAELHQGILVTSGEGSLQGKDGAATIEHKPYGTIHGRAIVPQGNSTALPVLNITASSIKKWCNEHSVSSKAMFDGLVAQRMVEPEMKKYSLGKGTREYGMAGQSICWILDPLAMGLDVSALQNNVRDLNAIGGGRKKYVSAAT